MRIYIYNKQKTYLVPGCDTGGPPPGARPGLWRCCGLLIAVGGLGQLPPPGLALLLAPTMPGMPIMLAGMPPCFMPPAAPIIIIFGFIPAPPIWDGILIRSPIGACNRKQNINGSFTLK